MVQYKYWNVGLFKYWKINHIGWFLLAVPAFFIATRYYMFPWIRKSFRTVIKSSKISWTGVQSLLKDEQSPFAIHLAACLLVTLLIANTHIVTRMLSSSPAYLWAQVEVLTSEKLWLLKYVLTVLHLSYFFIGPILFTNFLPWT
jgi:Gpi18-like mannosyltransferase